MFVLLLSIISPFIFNASFLSFIAFVPSLYSALLSLNLLVFLLVSVILIQLIAPGGRHRRPTFFCHLYGYKFYGGPSGLWQA